jgi:hypothetical protein
MYNHNDSVRKNSDGIGEEIRKANKALDLLLRRAKSTLRALNVELIDEEGERASPIAPTVDRVDRRASNLVTQPALQQGQRTSVADARVHQQ